VRKYHEHINSLGECGYPNCVFPLTINACVIIFMELSWRLLTNLILPWMKISLFDCFFRKKSKPLLGVPHTTLAPIVRKIELASSLPSEKNIGDHYLKKSDSEFQLNNPMISPFKSNRKLTLQRESSQYLKPKSEEETVEQVHECSNIDLNEDLAIGIPTRCTEDNKNNSSRFFPDSEPFDENTQYKYKTISGDEENEENQDLEREIQISIRSKVIEESSENESNDGFSSAGPQTPVKRGSSKDFFRDKSLSQPLHTNLENFYEDGDTFGRDEIFNSESNADLEESKTTDYYGQIQEEEVSNGAIPAFEMYSSRSYDSNYHHLSTHLFIFRLLAIALCFGVSIPGIFGALFFIFLIENRVSLWQKLYYYPRLLPEVAVSIDTIWIVAYDSLVLLSVATNASLIIFTLYGKSYSTWNMTHLLLLWIGIVLSLVLLYYYLQLWFSRTPKEVKVQNQRKKFIVDKLIHRIPDHQDSLPIEML
jgi:hypothetical protein